MVNSYRKSLWGWGINDLDYVTSVRTRDAEGNIGRLECPYYSRWKDIICRTKSITFHKRHPSYAETEAILDWKYASNFKGWMINQNWQGLELDKDILNRGNKIYSPDTCVFVPGYINRSILTSGANRGKLPIGVSIKQIGSNRNKNYQAGVRDVLLNKRVGLGVYYTAADAHKAWQLAKADQLEILIDKYAREDCYLQSVGEAIFGRVSMLRADAAEGLETFYL